MEPQTKLDENIKAKLQEMLKEPDVDAIISWLSVRLQSCHQ